MFAERTPVWMRRKSKELPTLQGPERFQPGSLAGDMEVSARSWALLVILLRQHAQSHHGPVGAEGNGTPQRGRGAGRVGVA